MHIFKRAVVKSILLSIMAVMAGSSRAQAAAAKPATTVTVFESNGSFKNLLPDSTACASPDSLSGYSLAVSVNQKAANATLVAVCPAAVTISLPATDAAKAPTPASGRLTKADGTVSVALTSFTSATGTQVFNVSGDLKSLLDSPTACTPGSKFTAYVSESGKPLVAAKPIVACPDRVILAASGTPANALLTRQGKTPLQLSLGKTASPASPTDGTVFGAEQDFSALLNNPNICAPDDELKGFHAYLSFDGKPAATGTVTAVCAGSAFITADGVTAGQIPTGGLLWRSTPKVPPATTPSVPVELIFHQTYQKQIVAVTSSELSTLCDPCTAAALDTITATIAPAQGVAASPPPKVQSVQKGVAVVSFTAVTGFKPALVLLAQRGGASIIGTPLSGAPHERLLSAHGNFSVLTSNCLSDLSRVKGYINASQRVIEATVRGVCSNQVYFSTDGLDPGDKPSTGFIQSGTAGQPVQFDTIPYQTFVMALQGKGLDKICDKDCAAAPQCNLTVKLVPGPQSKLGGGEFPTVIAVNRNLVVIQFVAPLDFDIAHAEIHRENGCAADSCMVAVRPLPGPRPAGKQPNVTFAVVSPADVRLNFGRGIADHLIVVDLTVKNPGTKKIQLRKSAIWFEVDYSAVKPESNVPMLALKGSGRYQKDAEKSAQCEESDAAQTEPCKSRILETKIYRYGIDHVEQQTPEDWRTVLGDFDGFSFLAQEGGPKSIDLILGILTGLSGTAIHSRGLAQVLPKFTGIIAPAVKDYVWNSDEDKRKRTALLEQSFADIVQIAARSSVTTKVFLPRYPTGRLFGRSVIISEIRSVHMDLEVVTDTLTEAVTKGKIAAAMTQDQVIQALGVPDSKTDGASGSTWNYSTGNYSQVVFDKDGNVTSWTERPVTDQLDQLAGKGAESDVIALLQMPGPPNNAQPMWDGGTVWPMPLGISRTLRFGSDQKLVDANYSIASDKNNGFAELKGLAAADVQTKLDSYFADGKANRPSAPNPDSATLKVYASPDLKGQTVSVTFDDKGNAATITVQPAKF